MMGNNMQASWSTVGVVNLPCELRYFLVLACRYPVQTGGARVTMSLLLTQRI